MSSEHRLPSGQIARNPVDYNAPPEETHPREDPEQLSVETPVVPARALTEGDDSAHAAFPSGVSATEVDDSPRVPRWVWFAGGGVLAIGLGVTLMMVLTGGDGEALAAPSSSPTPSPTATTTAALPVAVGLLDDGIADDEYPAAATDRGEQYPSAYVMEDWV